MLLVFTIYSVKAQNVVSLYEAKNGLSLKSSGTVVPLTIKQFFGSNIIILL